MALPKNAVRKRRMPRFGLPLFLCGGVCAVSLSWNYAAQTPPAAHERLANGGFEAPFHPVSVEGASGEIADKWEDNSAWKPGSVRVYARTEDRCGGMTAQSVTLKPGKEGVAQIKQPFAWKPSLSEEYTVKVWLKGKSADGKTPLRVEVVLVQDFVPYSILLGGDFAVTDGWKEYTLRGMTGTTTGFLIFRTFTPGTFSVDEASLTAVPAPEPPKLRDREPIPRNFEGMHQNNRIATGPLLGKMGTRRSWGVMKSGWADIHKKRGTSPDCFDWDSLDAVVADSEKNGTEFLYTLGVTPKWASARPDEPSWLTPHIPEFTGSAAEPKEMEDLRDFATALATRYKGRIRYYEVWNEPNEHAFFSGSVEKLVEMERVFAGAIRAVDPKAQILGPSLTGGGGAVIYLEKYLAAGGERSADIIAFHGYHLGGTMPESIGALAYNIRQVLKQYRMEKKPLWNTEHGWEKSTGKWGETGVASQETGAALVSRILLLSWRYGIDRTILYTWDDWWWGALRFSEENQYDAPTLTGKAYAATRDWMAGNRMTGAATDAEGTYRIELTRPDGKKTYAVWNPDKPVLLTLPDAWKVTRLNRLDGSREPLDGKTPVRIGEAPMLFE